MTGFVPAETCPGCGFDGDQYDVQDTLGTLRALPAMWQQTFEGVGPDALDARTSPTERSAAGRLSAAATELADLAGLLRAILAEDDPSWPVLDPGAVAASEPVTAALRRLAEEAGRLQDEAGQIRGARDGRWARRAVLGDEVVDAAWVLRRAVHVGTHHLQDAARVLHEVGAGAPTHDGLVAQLNVSDGGLPKRAIEQAEVGLRGLLGDRQASRQHHGRPMQALCLWSLEVIEALRGEGHSVQPGLAGENVTLTGVDWARLRPGTRLRMGGVLAELSAWATPCKKNAAWFADRDFRRMDHDRHPGWSRAYAWVRVPGTIQVGDPVVVEP